MSTQMLDDFVVVRQNFHRRRFTFTEVNWETKSIFKQMVCRECEERGKVLAAALCCRGCSVFMLILSSCRRMFLAAGSLWVEVENLQIHHSEPKS